MTVQEGALEFAFPGVGDVTRLDGQDRARPQGMALVDFVVEEAERTLLIEVKDPSGASVPARERVPASELDPVEVQRLLTHPLPYWIETMTTAYVRHARDEGRGTTVVQKEGSPAVWQLQWP